MTKIRDEKYLKALGKKIKDIRKQKGISTYDLSYESNISRSQINSIEKGDINTSICTLKAIADALGLKVKDLVDF
ncbi:transcriptional regulator [Flagellimonas taeanensis]|jgi:transcriptional regulator with XRE-family HTH domain|uniref:Transcriptional regulator n=1 Tax=Flagellimonas taeanensis TaxID=1005926 RepID=A0A1M7C9N6_9FLAO|nr:helix-turn-helix transcriptional regulator [Allomuricauda taeanensis]RUA16555.1 MAG: XRE family transcriptional regulator [Flavobacteriia bacterium]SFC61340.1 transcriptional regulator [Allomuricauda taeanensis]SHL63924.1 XRE family transcriptional regulator, aerobic/anaerobic benzoate catabolism transcriptional regulator [Allomuricauda taeanensis]